MDELIKQRDALAYDAMMKYTDAFPGSRPWRIMQEAEKKLQEFDAAHPEVMPEIRRRDA